MAVLSEIAKGFEEGKRLFAQIKEQTGIEGFRLAETHTFDGTNEDGQNNMLACGDNVEYMKWLIDSGYGGRISCIYIDPPFFTKAKYNASVSLTDKEGKKHKVHHLAYDDRFERDLGCYIENMTVRLLLMKELLADDGLMWIHLDWHSSHYVKLLLDEIMGEKHFVNEIIWKYKSGGSGKRHFSRKHDSILVYSKTGKYKLNIPSEKSYNRGLKPYNFKGVKEYRDEFGWYTMVNMKDVWSIDMVGRTSSERTGYATQKPIELMKRIIEAATDEGDICADFFCGSGSFLVAAEQLGRRWIGCDTEELATAMTKKRLGGIEADYDYLTRNEELHRSRRAFFRQISREQLESGKCWYTYALESFMPDFDIGHVPLKERTLVSGLTGNDAFSLIDYIMVDPYYNGVFSPEMIVEEDFSNIRFISKGEIAFIVVDVFGREYISNNTGL